MQKKSYFDSKEVKEISNELFNKKFDEMIEELKTLLIKHKVLKER